MSSTLLPNRNLVIAVLRQRVGNVLAPGIFEVREVLLFACRTFEAAPVCEGGQRDEAYARCKLQDNVGLAGDSWADREEARCKYVSQSGQDAEDAR